MLGDATAAEVGGIEESLELGGLLEEGQLFDLGFLNMEALPDPDKFDVGNETLEFRAFGRQVFGLLETGPECKEL